MLAKNALKVVLSEIDDSIRGGVRALDDDAKSLISDLLGKVKGEQAKLVSAGALRAEQVILDHSGLPIPSNAHADYERVKTWAQKLLDGEHVANGEPTVPATEAAVPSVASQVTDDPNTDGEVSANLPAADPSEATSAQQDVPDATQAEVPAVDQSDQGDSSVPQPGPVSDTSA